MRNARSDLDQITGFLVIPADLVSCEPESAQGPYSFPFFPHFRVIAGLAGIRQPGAEPIRS
jgi:hypothetical protein